MKQYITVLISAIFCVLSCGGGAKPVTANEATEAPRSKQKTEVPMFNGDSAYNFVSKQVAFGPRVPNSQAHKACGDWLETTLRAYGADVVAQNVTLTAYTGEKLQARNIIAQFQPQKKKRIMLCAHWDSRPWADADPDPANHRKPILGANDGGSGVGVLLEVARHISLSPTELGIDIILFDAEDYGTHASESESSENSWALGSQYWSRIPHKENYNARFGILLDIVGAPGSKFYREGISQYFANNIVEKVWDAANKLGYADTFINEEIGAITDDHLYVNQFARIPCIDIINYDVESGSGFGAHWHTVNDNMEWISPETLEIVGQTVLTVIYNEK